MSLNYDFLETIKLFLGTLRYEVMIAIMISIIILVVLLILNKDNKKTNYVVSSINLVLIIIILLYYVKDIFKFDFSNPINNICFYFLNSILYLIFMSITSFRTKYKKTNFIIYGIVLINLLFSFFMTKYLNNNTLLVLFNIYPMIKFGNIIYIDFYILLCLEYVNKKIKKCNKKL